MIRDARLTDRDTICLLADQVNRDHHQQLQVSTIVVSSEVQREGVGRQLMLSAIDKGKCLGASETTLEVMAYNKDAQLFYETLGFSEFSRKMSLSFP